jgi:hypothetical protein
MTFRERHKAIEWAQRLADYHGCAYVVVEQYNMWRVYCINDLYDRRAVVEKFLPTSRRVEFLGRPL